VGRLDPASGDIARPLDALESRFITLVRTQIHGLQVLAAYYQLVAELQPARKAIALSSLAGALGSYPSNFAREADAYLAATARYAAVAGGNPAFLVADPATGVLTVDADLLTRLGRAPAVADAVRAIGVQLASASAGSAAANDAPTAANDAATAAPSDVVHAVFLARKTDAAFAHLLVTATDAGDPARATSIDLVAQSPSSGKPYVYGGHGAGRELHTQNGRYGVFVQAASGSGTELALSDGWWVYDVNLPLPARTSAAASPPNVQVVVTTKDAVGGAAFSKTFTVTPAFTASAGEPAVYVVADDYRMSGPTSRVDLFPWSAPTAAANNACRCEDYDDRYNWDDQCKVGAPTLASGSAPATGATADVSIITGRYTMNTGCNIEQTLAVTSTFRDQATNAVVFGAARQVRSADTVSWLSTGIFAAHKQVSLTCANDLYWFRDWGNAFKATNAVTLGNVAMTPATWTTVFTPEMTPSCEPDYLNDTGWLTGQDTLTSVSMDALGSRSGATWDSGVQVLTSPPQAFAPGASSTLSVSAGFQLPMGLSHVKVQTRLASFGVYVP
jgi:hypothetical protein